jgi:hypothetical protein
MATRATDTSAGSDRTARAKRILVLANEAVGSGRLVDEIVARAGDPDKAAVMIVSPALVSSPLDLAAGDVDDDIAGARRRLEISVYALRARGVEASGEVGEAEPDLALRDALVKFPADEVVVLAQPEESATWLEKDLLERVRRELTIPITHIEVKPADPAQVAEVTDVEPKARRVAAEQRAEEFDANYLPPLSTRDRFALALGPLGTVALWLLASSCQGELPQDFSGDAACIAITVLAIFGTVTAAIHVPATLLLRSGRYTSRGLAEFMSLFMFVYFIPALVVATILALVA